MSEPAGSIDQVIDELTEIIDVSRAEASRLGYFPALYRKVTIAVRDGIGAGEFDDGERMARLDVNFANRYLAALRAHRTGAPCSKPWAYAFRVAGQRLPIVLQHLLLGINAHINFDLGVATAETVTAEELPGLRADFDRINKVLSSLVGEVQAELAEIWPALRTMEPYLGRADDAIINFSMDRARDHAWRAAEQLAGKTATEAEWELRKLETTAAAIGRLVRHPGALGSAAVLVVRMGERGGVARKIGILE